MARVFFAFIFFFSFSCGQTLQELADNAAKTGQKRLALENKTYVLTEPLRLGAEHSGLSIEGSGGTKIIGGRKIGNWEPDGGLWKAKLEGVKFVSSLYVNGKRAELSSFPKGRFLFMKSPYPAGGGNCAGTAFIVRNEDIEFLKNLSEDELLSVDFDVYMSWVNNRLAFDRIEPRKDGKTSAVYFKEPGASTPFFQYDANPRFKIANSRAAITEDGEYAFDIADSVIYYKPRRGEDIKTALAYVPVLETIFEVKGRGPARRVENITVKNVAFEYGGNIPKHGNRSFDNAVQAAYNAPSFILFEHAKNVSLQNCSIRHCDGYAVTFANSVWDARVENCEIFDSGSGGVRVGTTAKSGDFETPESDGITSGRIKISNNIIYGYGRWCKSGIGVLVFDASDVEISHNEIFDGYYSGVSTGWTWGSGPTHTKNLKIISNRIHDLSFAVMSDLGGIYTLGVSPGSEISGNHIYDINCHAYGGWGIYNDEGSSGFAVSKNFVQGAQEGGYFMHYGRGCKIFNNVFCFSSDFQIGLGRQGENSFSFERNAVVYTSPALLMRANTPPNPESATFEKNIYWNTNGEVKFGGMDFARWQASGRDKGSFVGPVDVDKLMNGAPIEKIGFEPLNVKDAGVKGPMKKRLREIMKTHKMPDVVRTPIEADWETDIDDTFEFDEVGSAPSEIRANGQKFYIARDPDFGKVMRVEDLPSDPAWMPYAYYTCKFKGPGIVKISFMLKLSPTTNFLFDVRDAPVGTGGPSFRIKDLKIEDNGSQTTLPADKWLKVEAEIPVSSSASNGSWALKISDGDNTLLDSARTSPNQNFNEIKWIGFIMDGNDGAPTDFAGIKIKKL